MTETPSRPAALVTGASRGIGRAIAVALGHAGYNVAINYRANREAARESAALVGATGAEAPILRADLADPEERTELARLAESALGPLALLVNNAGISVQKRDDLLDVTLDGYRKVLATNLEGPFFLAQSVARRMIEHRDRLPKTVFPAIVNIGSLSAYAVSLQRAEYCLAKAGMAMLTQLLAARLAEHQIAVYEVRPGIIATDMTAGAKAKYDRLIGEESLLPIARWGQPDDVARAVVALIRGDFSYSTGSVLDVDGGYHIRRL